MKITGLLMLIWLIKYISCNDHLSYAKTDEGDPKREYDIEDFDFLKNDELTTSDLKVRTPLVNDAIISLNRKNTKNNDLLKDISSTIKPLTSQNTRPSLLSWGKKLQSFGSKILNPLKNTFKTHAEMTKTSVMNQTPRVYHSYYTDRYDFEVPKEKNRKFHYQSLELPNEVSTKINDNKEDSFLTLSNVLNNFITNSYTSLLGDYFNTMEPKLITNEEEMIPCENTVKEEQVVVESDITQSGFLSNENIDNFTSNSPLIIKKNTSDLSESDNNMTGIDDFELDLIDTTNKEQYGNEINSNPKLNSDNILSTLEMSTDQGDEYLQNSVIENTDQLKLPFSINENVIPTVFMNGENSTFEEEIILKNNSLETDNIKTNDNEIKNPKKNIYKNNQLLENRKSETMLHKATAIEKVTNLEQDFQKELRNRSSFLPNKKFIMEKLAVNENTSQITVPILFERFRTTENSMNPTEGFRQLTSGKQVQLDKRINKNQECTVEKIATTQYGWDRGSGYMELIRTITPKFNQIRMSSVSKGLPSFTRRITSFEFTVPNYDFFLKQGTLNVSLNCGNVTLSEDDKNRKTTLSEPERLLAKEFSSTDITTSGNLTCQDEQPFKPKILPSFLDNELSSTANTTKSTEKCDNSNFSNTIKTLYFPIEKINDLVLNQHLSTQDGMQYKKHFTSYNEQVENLTRTKPKALVDIITESSHIKEKVKPKALVDIITESSHIKEKVKPKALVDIITESSHIKEKVKPKASKNHFSVYDKRNQEKFFKKSNFNHTSEAEKQFINLEQNNSRKILLKAPEKLLVANDEKLSFLNKYSTLPLLKDKTEKIISIQKDKADIKFKPDQSQFTTPSLKNSDFDFSVNFNIEIGYITQSPETTKPTPNLQKIYPLNYITTYPIPTTAEKITLFPKNPRKLSPTEFSFYVGLLNNRLLSNPTIEKQKFNEKILNKFYSVHNAEKEFGTERIGKTEEESVVLSTENGGEELIKSSSEKHDHFKGSNVVSKVIQSENNMYGKSFIISMTTSDSLGTQELLKQKNNNREYFESSTFDDANALLAIPTENIGDVTKKGDKVEQKISTLSINSLQYEIPANNYSLYEMFTPKSNKMELLDKVYQKSDGKWVGLALFGNQSLFPNNFSLFQDFLGPFLPDKLFGICNKNDSIIHDSSSKGNSFLDLSLTQILEDMPLNYLNTSNISILNQSPNLFESIISMDNSSEKNDVLEKSLKEFENPNEIANNKTKEKELKANISFISLFDNQLSNKSAAGNKMSSKKIPNLITTPVMNLNKNNLLDSVKVIKDIYLNSKKENDKDNWKHEIQAKIDESLQPKILNVHIEDDLEPDYERIRDQLTFIIKTNLQHLNIEHDALAKFLSKKHTFQNSLNMNKAFNIGLRFNPRYLKGRKKRQEIKKNLKETQIEELKNIVRHNLAYLSLDKGPFINYILSGKQEPIRRNQYRNPYNLRKSFKTEMQNLINKNSENIKHHEALKGKLHNPELSNIEREKYITENTV